MYRFFLTGFLIVADMPASPPAFFFEDGQSVIGRTPAMAARFEVGAVRLLRADGALTIEFVGANPVAPKVTDSSGAVLNVLLGAARENWKTAIPLHSAVMYRHLYRGIDLRWSSTGGRLKSEFFVAPGAGVSAIRLRYPGAALAADGSLNAGSLRELPPVCWAGEERRPVECRYVMRAHGLVGFEVNGRAPGETLVIDPVVTYSTYIGGTGIDVATGVALDSSGNAYVCGYTDSSDFPLVGAPYAAQGSVDGFVFKLNSAGNQLLYATYIGGSGDDRVFGCTIDGGGVVHLAGATSSSNFPIVPAGASASGGGRDAFVMKLNENGSQVAYSTVLGGSSTDAANAIALDSAGSAYIAGETASANLPIIADVYQSANRGRQEAFVSKLSSTGAVVFTTYLGGGGDERGLAVRVDSAGAIFVAGGTTSADFPTSSPAYQSLNRGGQDCFVAKFDSSAGSIFWSTYLGGSGGTAGLQEQCNGLALDGAGNVYVAGATSSADFPLLNPLQTAIAGGGADGFVAKFSSSGALVYSTYFGTGGIDQLLGIAVDAGGQAYVAGKTSGSALPLADPLQSTYAAGGYDAYAARIRAAGNSLDFSSYLGGSGIDSANAITVNASGTVALAGQTTSPDFPLANSFQSVAGSDGSAFVSTFILTPPAVAAQPPSTGPGAEPSSSIEPRQRFTFQLSDPNGFQEIQIVSIVVASTATTAPPNCHVYYNRAGNLFYLYDDGNVPLGSVAPGSSGTLENSQCKFYAASSQASGSVNTLNLTVDIERKSSYYGAKNVYVWLNDTTGRSAGMDQKAIWNITAQNVPPSTGPAAQPSSITAARQTIVFEPTDSNGFGDITIVSAVVSSAAAAPPGTCHAYYNRLSNLFYLLSDSNQTLGPLSPGSASALQNSQCILYGQNSRAAGTGAALNIQFDLEMLPLYSGMRNVYLWVNDSLNASAGLDLKGNWDIPAAPNVVPSTGPAAVPDPVTGARSVIRIVPSDGNGYQDIRVVSILVHASPTVQQNSCHIYLNRLTGLFYLYSDTNSPLGPAAPGSSDILENSQCRFHAAASSFAGSGNDLVVEADIERKAAYGGSKGVYLWLNDSKNADAGLDLKATWSAP